MYKVHANYEDENGLNIDGTRFLLHAHKLGVDFSHTCMIGRQGLHLTVAELESNLKDFGFDASSAIVYLHYQRLVITK